VQKPNAGENQRPAASERGEACARGITAGKTQRSLRTQQQRQYMAFWLKTDSLVVTLTFDLLAPK